MSNELKFGRGYKELGLAADAKAEFEKVPASDPQYDRARAHLMTLANQSDIAEQSREADEGLKLIQSGSRSQFLIGQTALRLHFAGRTQEAYDLTRDMGGYLEWDAADHYGMANYAAQIGKYEEAAREMLSGLRKDADRMVEFDRMFSDIDFEPLYRHAAEGAMNIETAFIFANHLVVAAFGRYVGRELEFDGLLLRRMPQRLLPFLKKDLVSGLYSISAQAPDRMQGDIRKWLQSEYDKIASLARRGIERALEMILDAQLEFATSAAKRGDFFAARHHMFFAITRNPERFAEFDAALSPLGMEYLFGDIRTAMKDDPNFCKLLSFIKPVKILSSQQIMELLDGCSPAGKATTLWMLLRAGVAGDVEGIEVAKDWYIEVIRRWPNDPLAFLNILKNYEKTNCWDAAALVFANVPPAFRHFRVADIHSQRVELRGMGHWIEPSGYAPFYGQPDIGGTVDLPLEDPQTSGKLCEEIMKKPTDEACPQKYEEVE